MPEKTERPNGENRLADEVSPYLLQHKDNPVDWYPWGQAAFDKARQENKPILLSVGYAACHWCHVMAHESFEDPEVAALMNALFVNIKVDREERPDLDAIYQQALALLGQHGGWPLTMFLTPMAEPFWGGTYFPKADIYGRPGFTRVLQAIAEVFRDEPEKVTKNVNAIQESLESMAKPQAAGQVDPAILDETAKRVAQAVDTINGGLGGPPKFPQPGLLALLWRGWTRHGDTAFQAPVTLTLRRMSQGGIYDHLGGGYARYAVDSQWLIPHFEKMLYDNAQILALLTWAWLDTGDQLYRERSYETVNWLLREMIALDAEGQPIGAFAATLDADSEGEEGKFYTWTAAEIDAVLGENAELFKRIYNVLPNGNWEGVNILNRLDHPDPLDATSEERLVLARQALFERREKRVRPGWDDKVLADWNGLMIARLVEAAAAFDEPAWHTAAVNAFTFVCTRMQSEGRLYHTWRRDHLKHPATLDDYAAMIEAALTLFEHTGQVTYFETARDWTVIVEKHFRDKTNGGYFTTADDVTDVILRIKHAHDSAQPAGNGLMLHNLARLHYLTGESVYRERAEDLIAAFSGELERNFIPMATFLNGIDRLYNTQQIVLIGAMEDPNLHDLKRAVQDLCLPNRLLYIVHPERALPSDHPAYGKTALAGQATAYVCHGQSCAPPVISASALRQTLVTA